MPPQLSSVPEVKRSASVLRVLDTSRDWKDRPLFERYGDGQSARRQPARVGPPKPRPMKEM